MITKKKKRDAENSKKILIINVYKIYHIFQQFDPN